MSEEERGGEGDEMIVETGISDERIGETEEPKSSNNREGGCIRTYVHTYIHTYIHTSCRCTYVHTYIHTYIHTLYFTVTCRYMYLHM